MKKYIGLLCCSLMVTAAHAVNVHINNINSSSGFYSFRLYAPPFDNNEAHAVPTRLGFGFLNSYLQSVNASPQNYLTFGYYDYFSQQTTWFPSTCTIVLDKPQAVNVYITADSCVIN
ncbi:MAG TPA: hypothetical protein VI844_02415 [Coxiellaceae bacterium]|nr:hypothetical protein [Coxiellaceae bacterium]